MKIIRDEELFGLDMIPLFVEWGVKRCNVAGCRAKPTTIVQGLAGGIPLAGFCEEHFQQANVPGGTKFKLEFDGYDAFSSKQEAVEP